MSRKSAKDLEKFYENACPICASKELAMFFEMADVPVHCNVPWRSHSAARNFPRGDIRLAFCPVCSYIMNLEFDPARVQYTQAYENSLHFSPLFKDYARSLAMHLIQRYDLHNKDIIEIGCGKGYFLTLLCQLGNNRGVGFDATYVEQEEHNKMRGQVKFIQDHYSDRYSDYKGDLFICRQTLEHIQNPKAFLKMLRCNIDDRFETKVFFEVPNALSIFRRLFIWDIIYEHCSYFTPYALSLAFSSAGFHVCELTEEFGGQYLSIHAIPADHNVPNRDGKQQHETEQIAHDIAVFEDSYEDKVSSCGRKLEHMKKRGTRAVVWGAGSKGVMFLNVLKDTSIEYVVDVNPYKQGMFVPGTGQQIVPPEFLTDYMPSVIIVMNHIYLHEIQELVRKLGLAPDFVLA